MSGILLFLKVWPTTIRMSWQWAYFKIWYVTQLKDLRISSWNRRTLSESFLTMLCRSLQYAAMSSFMYGLILLTPLSWVSRKEVLQDLCWKGRFYKSWFPRKQGKVRQTAVGTLSLLRKHCQGQTPPRWQRHGLLSTQECLENQRMLVCPVLGKTRPGIHRWYISTRLPRW